MRNLQFQSSCDYLEVVMKLLQKLAFKSLENYLKKYFLSSKTLSGMLFLLKYV